MDWIFDNLGLVITVATVIAVWLNNRRRENQGDSADYDQDGVPDNRFPPQPDTRPFAGGEAEMEQAERVRRIQEEIRRKIAERRGQASPPAMPMPASRTESYEAPPPMPAPSGVPQRTGFPQAPTPPSMPPPPLPTAREVVFVPDETQAALERQRRLAEEMEALEERRRQAQRSARALATATAGTSAIAKSEADVWSTPAASPGTTFAPARGIAAELRDRRALRRAVIWREVLDRPVGLR